MIIERRIEDAMVTRLEARAYFIAQSISARGYDDRAELDGGIIAVVMCEPVTRIEPNYNLYSTLLSVVALNNSEADVEGDDMAALYADILDELMNDMTAASLTASINNVAVIIDGVVGDPGTYDGGDKYKMLAAQARLFLTYTP